MPELGFGAIREIIKLLQRAALEQIWKSMQLVGVLMVDLDTAFNWLRDLHLLATGEDPTKWKPKVVGPVSFDNAVEAYLCAEACVLGSFIGATDAEKGGWLDELEEFINGHGTAGLESLIASMCLWAGPAADPAAFDRAAAWLASLVEDDTHGAGLPGIRTVESIPGQLPSVAVGFASTSEMKAEAAAFKQAVLAGNAAMATNEIRSMNDDPAASGMPWASRQVFCEFVGWAAGKLADDGEGGLFNDILKKGLDSAAKVVCISSITTDEEKAAAGREQKRLDAEVEQWDSTVDNAKINTGNAETNLTTAKGATQTAEDNLKNAPATATDAEKAKLQQAVDNAKTQEAAAKVQVDNAKAAQGLAEASRTGAKKQADEHRENTKKMPSPEEISRNGLSPEQSLALWTAVLGVRRDRVTNPTFDTGPTSTGLPKPSLAPLIYPRADQPGHSQVMPNKATAIDPSPDAMTVVPVFSPIAAGTNTVTGTSFYYFSSTVGGMGPSSAIAYGVRLTGDLFAIADNADGSATVNFTQS